MSSLDMDGPEMFSQAWYNEYFRRAAASQTHALFCEKVYGRNLCQHGMMDMAELDFLISLTPPDAQVLEVGCSNGYISEYISDHAGCSILGIDFSDVAIHQARERTREKSGALRFECVDLTQQAIPGNGFDIILLIDSIYFLGEFGDTLPMFMEKLNDSGKLILTAFDLKMEGDPQDILRADRTHLAQALKTLGYRYSSYDFTENVRNHWLKNHRVGDELQHAFSDEGNQFLYQARRKENTHFKAYVDRDEIARYMYVVNRSPAA